MRKLDHSSDACHHWRSLLYPATDLCVFWYNRACYACQIGKIEEAREWLTRALDQAKRDGSKVFETVKMKSLEDEDLKPIWTSIPENPPF